MAQQVGKYAANKILKKHMKQYQGKKVEAGSDPYFAMVEDPRRPGKYKKVKKQAPAYIPEHDAAILNDVRKSAYRLDWCLFNLFGIRFGWESVIGIVPEVGDAIGAILAFNVYRKCCKVEGGLSTSIKIRMMLNIIADFAVGLVPILGDLVDAAFKCNTRNLSLLEATLDKKYRPQIPDERHLAGVDQEKRRKNRASGIFHLNDPPPATAFEEFSDDEMHEIDPDYQQAQHQQGQQQPMRAPPPYSAPRQENVRVQR